MAWPTLTLRDVLAARKRIRPYLRPTALLNYPALDELVGATVFVKHENHQPTGAFKVRGGINLVSQLTEEERTRGMITASTGNHGKSIAHAARLFGIPVTVCVPEGANPLKVASMQSLGATVVCQGRDFDDARVHCEALASAHGLRYIHSGDEPHLIAGVGTCTLEILEDRPESTSSSSLWGAEVEPRERAWWPKRSTHVLKSSRCNRRRHRRPTGRGAPGNWLRRR